MKLHILILLTLFLASSCADKQSSTNAPDQPKQLTSTTNQQSVPAAETRDLKIKGNRKSRIYHLPGCPNYNDIADKNIVSFKTTEEAEKAGFRMARNC